jgi:hypothetical protein
MLQDPKMCRVIGMVLIALMAACFFLEVKSPQVPWQPGLAHSSKLTPSTSIFP